MAIADSGRRYPHRFARDWWAALADVLGDSGRTALLANAGVTLFRTTQPPDDLTLGVDFAVFAAINAAFDDLYGERGGRGLALRAGRSWFGGGLKTFGALRGMADPAFRALPLDTRTRLGVTALAEIFTRFSDQATAVTITPAAFLFTFAPSPLAWGRRSPRPVCQPLVGLVQEGMRWFSNGRDYSVREIHCCATGAAECVISINRQPLA